MPPNVAAAASATGGGGAARPAHSVVTIPDDLVDPVDSRGVNKPPTPAGLPSAVVITVRFTDRPDLVLPECPTHYTAAWLRTCVVEQHPSLHARHLRFIHNGHILQETESFERAGVGPNAVILCAESEGAPSTAQDVCLFGTIKDAFG